MVININKTKAKFNILSDTVALNHYITNLKTFDSTAEMGIAGQIFSEVHLQLIFKFYFYCFHLITNHFAKYS
jgi:hypothetical protein